MNATMAIVNYPLCLLSLLIVRDQAAYIGILIMLWFNKIALSFFGGKVRQHFVNPGYAKTCDKMQKHLEQLLQADGSGRFKGLTAAERAQTLVASGKPQSLDQQVSDEEITYSDPNLFGITSTSELKKPKL